MRTVLLASLRTHTRRYVAALVAVVVAVAFVIVVNALASATKSGLSSGVEAAYPGAQLVVGDRTGLEDGEVEKVETIARDQGDRTAVVAGTWTDVSVGGRGLGSEVSVSSVADDPDLRRQKVTAGRAPRAPDEALVDRGASRSDGVKIGDVLTIGAGRSAAEVRVVGLAASASYLSADVYVPWSTLRGLPGVWTDAVVYATGPDQVEARKDGLDRALSAPVRTRDAFVDDRVQEVNQGVDVVSYLLLTFAAIAGFIATLVITNTFTILFAQRSRDLALLRCVGATRRQVVRSVRAESVALAIVGSALGVLVGAVLGYGAAAVVRSLAGSGTIGAVTLSPVWIVTAFIGGVVVTSLAAWWPTQRVVRVSPLAALRPAETPRPLRGAGRLRTALGALALTSCTAALVVAVAANELPLLLLGTMGSFVGVLLLGPVIVPRLVAGLGRVTGRSGPSVRIAAANSARNPHRTATTTASLLIGVTLATTVMTGMASARSAVNHEMDGDHPVDVALTSERPLGPEVMRDVGAVRGVASSATVRGVVTSASRLGTVTALAPDEAALAESRAPSRVRPAAGTVLVPEDVAADVRGDLPRRLRLTTDSGAVALRVKVVAGGWGEAVVVPSSALARLAPSADVHAVWVRADDGTDADRIGRDLGGVARTSDATLVNSLKDRAWVDLQLDILVWSVLGLLGVGIAIALVGIANTVGLSVLERGREHALLRALGLTRGQLRRVLTAEGLLLATVAAGLGTALGVLYGWLGVLTIVRTAVPDAPLVMPWGSLVAVIAAAALSGPIACVLPARRAARVSPAAGLTLD